MTNYSTKSNMVVQAEVVEESCYYGNLLAMKGDYVVKIGEFIECLIRKDIFEALFQKVPSCLQEAIELQGGNQCQSV